MEAGSFPVLSASIRHHASMPVSITPVSLNSLEGIFTRERSPLQSSDFSLSRFMVPWMCNYEGWAIWMDCDMLVRDDISKLWAWRNDSFSMMCVHHTHIPKEETKYLDNIQSKYERKNWSSVMLFNNSRCKTLTPEYVNTASGLDLHQFKWLKDNEIGYLPKTWNHLVGYDKYDPQAKCVHFTIGGPYFKEYANCDYHQDWWKEKSLSEVIVQNEPQKS